FVLDVRVICVSLVHVIGALIQQPVGRQSAAMRPRIIGVHVHVPAGAPPCLQQHTVIALRAAVVVLRDVAKVGLRVREIEHTALIDVSWCRTRAWGEKAVLSRNTISRNVLSGIELDCIPYMNDIFSYVVSRYEQPRSALR